MSDLFFSSGIALWLGILTAISPCPLATNIAAISFIGRKVESPSAVFGCGVLYSLGRMLAYILIATFIVWGLLSAPSLSSFLQKYMHLMLGPVLILVGMVLMGLLSINLPGFTASEKFQTQLANNGAWGAAILGFIFALSFCPISAALFFGSLIPLSLQRKSFLLLPSLYGFGTALPVVAVAIILATGARTIGQWFNRIQIIQTWAVRITGVLFIAIGIYYCLVHIFEI